MGSEGEETWGIVAGPETKTLGLTPQLPPGRVVIIDVEDGGWAQGQGIRIGDEIVALNDGLVAAEMLESTFMKLLRSRPLRMTLREGEIESPRPGDQEEWLVRVGRHVERLGFTPQLPPGPVTILETEAGGWAEREGIQVGDEIVAVNDEATMVADMSEELFSKLLRSRPLTMTLRVGENEPAVPKQTSPKLDKQGELQVSVGITVQKLGLTPQLPPGRLIISDVAAGGWAESAGIRVGDEILTLNDMRKPAAEMSEETFMKLLRSRPLKMSLRQNGIEATPERGAFELDTKEETWVVEVGNNVESLGFVPHLPPGPVIILDVVDGSWADKAGVRVGHEILTVNDEMVPAAKMSDKTFLNLVKARPLEMTMRQAPLHLLQEALKAVDDAEAADDDPSQDGDNSQDEWVVNAGTDVQRLGFTPQLPPGPVAILDVDPGGWAESQGIEVGDEILTVNDEMIPAAQMSEKTFKKLLRMRPLEIALRHGSGDATQEEPIQQELSVEGDTVVTAGREVERLGFTPQFPPGPVVVLDVEAGGWAEYSGIAVNDEILALNDETTLAADMSEKAFKKLMKARPVRMVLKHGNPDFLHDDAEAEPLIKDTYKVPRTPSPRGPDIPATESLAAARTPEKQDISARLLSEEKPKTTRFDDQKHVCRDMEGTPEFYARAAKEQLEQQDRERSAEVHRLQQGINEQTAAHQKELERMRKKHEDEKYMLKLGLQDNEKDMFYAAERNRLQDLADSREIAERARLEAADLARAREDAERARHEAMKLKMQLANVAREEAQRSKEEAQLLRAQLQEIRQPLQGQNAAETNPGSVVTAGAKVKALGFTPQLPPGQVIVLEVQEGGWAESVNMQPGDEILALNTKGGDVPTVDMSEKEFKKMMTLRPLQFVLKRMPRNFSVLPPTGRFKTRLVISGAKQLRAGDALRVTPNPACTCTIVGKPQSEVETEVAKQTSNPWWNHEAELKDFSVGDSLKFVVSDKASGSKEFLGEVTMKAMSFVPDGFDGQLELVNNNGDATRQKILLRVELLGTPVWTREAEQGHWTYVVLRAEGIGIRRTPRFDKREELAEKLEEGQLITVVERRFGDGVLFMRLDTPRGWIIELLPGRGLNERLEEVTVDKGSWRYRVLPIDGLEFRSRCTLSDAAKNGSGLRVGSVATVTERIKVRQTRFLKVGVKGWLFDRAADEEIAMAPVDVLAVDDDFAENAEKSKLRAARRQEEVRKQQEEEERWRRQKEAYDREVERQEVELAYQDWWRQEQMKQQEAETKKVKVDYENHGKDYDDLRHQLAMQRHEKALRQYEENDREEEQDADRYVSGFSHFVAPKQQITRNQQVASPRPAANKHVASPRSAGFQQSPRNNKPVDFTLVVDKKVKTMGFYPCMPPGEVLINEVNEGSWAEKQGICIGDEILRFGDDDTPAANMSAETFQAMMSKRPLKMHLRRMPNEASSSSKGDAMKRQNFDAELTKKLDMSSYRGPDPVLEAKIGVAVDAINKLRRVDDGYSDRSAAAEFVSPRSSPTKTEPDPEPSWAGLTKQLGAMDAAVDDLHWGAMVSDGQAHFQRPKVGPAPPLAQQGAEASASDLPGGLQGYQAQKLASNLASVCAGAFYWSTNMHDHERRQLVDLLLAHLRPCAHYDRGVTALIQDLEIERRRLAGGWEEPEPVPLEWTPALVQEPRRQKLQNPQRKPPDLSRPQRPFLFDDPVLSSLLAWKEEDSEAVRAHELDHHSEDEEEEEAELTLAKAMQERLQMQE